MIDGHRYDDRCVWGSSCCPGRARAWGRDHTEILSTWLQRIIFTNIERETHLHHRDDNCPVWRERERKTERERDRDRDRQRQTETDREGDEGGGLWLLTRDSWRCQHMWCHAGMAVQGHVCYFICKYMVFMFLHLAGGGRHLCTVLVMSLFS